MIRNRLTQHVKVLITRQIVANYVVSLPASKQRKTRPDLYLHWVIQNLQVGGGDVSNLIPIVNVLGRGREDSLVRRIYIIIRETVKAQMTLVGCLEETNLEGLDRWDAAVWLTLVIITWKGALQNGSGVPQVDGFFHCNVAPVRHLNGTSDAADGEEGCVVFIMDLHCVLDRGEHKQTADQFSSCFVASL